MKPRNLSARNQQILCSIVRAYIESGQPVASSGISRLGRHGLSSATIRNVMAELDSDGYLSQPHTSAGRVPTGPAYKVFVESIPDQRVFHAEFDRIRETLGGAGSIAERMERCSSLLSRMTSGVAISAAIPASSQTLDQIHLVSLGGERVLMIVVTRDHMVREQVVTLDETIAQSELNSICNYVNLNFGGWVLSEAQAELRRRLEQASAAYDLILKKLILLYEKGLMRLTLQPEVHLQGAGNLVAFELQLTKERLQELFRILGEKRVMLQLLERFLEQPAGEVGVCVGLAEENPDMRELSLIGISVETPSGMAAKIGVLGPLRMNYPKAMSAVLHVGRALGSLPS